MDKNFGLYFGKNISRKIYVMGLALCIIGFAVAFLYWVGYGAPLMVIGVIMFFIGSAKQISQKDIDEKIAFDNANYISYLASKPGVERNFAEKYNYSSFSGFIRETGETRFRIDRDGKTRTSTYYITAIGADKNGFRIFISIFDFISAKEISFENIELKKKDLINLEKLHLDFPKGNYKCKLKYNRGNEECEFEFFVPNDALADKLLDIIIR